MNISQNQLIVLQDFIGDPNIDNEWFLRHTDIKLDATTKTVTITINNINEQEFEWLNET